MHENGIIHRDIKFDNIVMDAKGNLSLTDFGLSLWLKEKDQPQRIQGTPEFIAPEIWVK